MPGFDRTGPAGMGPMTGWGRGRCTPSGRRTDRGYFGPRFGWGGVGRGWRHWHRVSGSPGWGRGWFQGPYQEPSYTREDEMALLQEEASMLKGELETIEQRLRELETRQER